MKNPKVPRCHVTLLAALLVSAAGNALPLPTSVALSRQKSFCLCPSPREARTSELWLLLSRSERLQTFTAY